MLKTLVFVGAIAALSTPVLAADVKVSLAGKTAAEVHAEIGKAARQVCAEASRETPLGVLTAESCVKWAVANAMSQLPKQMASLN